MAASHTPALVPVFAAADAGEIAIANTALFAAAVAAIVAAIIAVVLTDTAL